MKILVVEDQTQIRQVLIKALLRRSKGLEIDQSEDAQIALNLLLEGDYSLLITDFHMGPFSGLDLIGVVGMTNNYEMPILLMSGGCTDEEVETARRLARGRFAFMRKPFLLPDLYKILDDLVPGWSK